MWIRTEAVMSFPLKIVVVAIVAAFAFATVANAENTEKVRKHKKVATTSRTVGADPYHRGTNLVPAGPLYFSGVYLGDDPDPNIRFQLMRDISGRFGGEN
jgi:hypothetical protein